MHNGPYTSIISAVGGLLQGSPIQFEDKVVPGASTVTLASEEDITGWTQVGPL